MFIYIITHPAFKDWIKIGTTNNLKSRLKNYQTHCPDKAFKIEFSIELNEDRLGLLFDAFLKKFMKDDAGEWYKISVEQAIKEITEIVNIMNNHNCVNELNNKLKYSLQIN